VSDDTLSVSVMAPAKVNLTLDVFPRRSDGYHDLDSVVVCFASPADTVTVTVRVGAASGPTPTPITLIVKHGPEGLPKGPENLVHAAVTRYLALTRIRPTRVFVKLDKRLPLQAGLGGGSSDAAAALLALDQLLQPLGASVSAAMLQEIAAAIGSDVPLFLHGGALVRMRGRGEIVEPIETRLPKLWGVIVKPTSGVPTGPAYAALDALYGRSPGGATERLLAAFPHRSESEAFGDPAPSRGGPHPLAPSPGAAGEGEIGAASPRVEDLARLMANDFEDAILTGYPDVAAAHHAVRSAGALRALLCGSGAAVFGLATDREHARGLVRALVGRFPFVHIAESITTAAEPA
jgi:4-diphosphocytidyl-2-C-methyl-D-erythritol kinase